MMNLKDAQRIVDMLYDHMNDLYEKFLDAKTNEEMIEANYKYGEAQIAFYDACKVRDQIAA